MIDRDYVCLHSEENVYLYINDDMYGAVFFLIGFNIVKISQLKNLKSDRHETLNILQLQTLTTEQVEGL